MMLRYRPSTARLETISDAIALRLWNSLLLLSLTRQIDLGDLTDGKEDENWEMIDTPETQDDAAGQVKTSRLRRWFGANKPKQKGKEKESQIGTSSQPLLPNNPEPNNQDEVFYDASETTPLLSDQTPTYISPFSPHFDHIPSAGPGEYNNDCQTFYEATADIHLWAKDKIICYVDDLEIIDDHFAMKEGEDDGTEMWVDEGDDVCLLRGGHGISADYVPRKGKSRGRAMKRIDEKSQPETDGGSSGWKPLHPDLCGTRPVFETEVADWERDARRRMVLDRDFEDDKDESDFGLAASDEEEGMAVPGAWTKKEVVVDRDGLDWDTMNALEEGSLKRNGD